ncbi:NF-kappa-B inhibitor zeta [Synchiropus picturatus]
MLEVAEGTTVCSTLFAHNRPFEERGAMKRPPACEADCLDEQLIKISKWDDQVFDIICHGSDLTALPESAQPPQPSPHKPPPKEPAMTLFQWQVCQEARRQAGVPVELLGVQDEDGDTCLHIAVAQGRRALAFVLGEKMAARGLLDTREHNGLTALHCAAATNQHLIISDLLTHGAEVDTRDRWGRTPLHVCAEKGHFLSLQSIWKTLAGLGRHVDPDLLNYEGLTPLHVAVTSHNHVVKQLRLQGNSCSRHRKELLRKKMTLSGCVQTLLNLGATCGTKELKSGRTSLHMAAEAANIELLCLFLEQTSTDEVNAQTFSGNTSLHLASSLDGNRDQLAAVKLLLRRGADPSIRNSEKEQPSQMVPAGPTGVKVWKTLKGKSL